MKRGKPYGGNWTDTSNSLTRWGAGTGFSKDRTAGRNVELTSSFQTLCICLMYRRYPIREAFGGGMSFICFNSRNV
jgi:hypothetical protein